MIGYILVKNKVHTPNMLQDIPYEELQSGFLCGPTGWRKLARLAVILDFFL